MLSNNTADFGGVVYSVNNCHISFKENSTTVLNNNTVYNNGTVYAENNCYIFFGENSTTVFSNNIADYGGAILANYQCEITLIMQLFSLITTQQKQEVQQFTLPMTLK